MQTIVGLHGCFEIGQMIVDALFNRYINFRRGSPKHHQTATTLLFAETTDIVTQSFDHLPTGSARLHIIATESFRIVMIKGCLHRHNLFEFFSYGFDILLLQHLSIDSRLVGILRIDIPTAEHDIVETGQWNDITVLQILLRGSTSHTDLVVLSHRAHRLRQSFAGHQHTSHECRGNCAVADYQNTQLTFCWFYVCFVHVVLFRFNLFQ